MPHLVVAVLLTLAPWTHLSSPSSGQTLAGASQTQAAFRARLSPVPIDLAMQDTVKGRGSVTATLAGATLTVTGEFAGLHSPATIARLHVGPKGIRGPALGTLTITPATKGTISGRLELTPAQVEDLTHQRVYVQVHSEKAPDGNLWGWLLPREGRK